MFAEECVERAIKDEFKHGRGVATKHGCATRASMYIRQHQRASVEVTEAAKQQVIMTMVDRVFSRAMPVAEVDRMIKKALARNMPMSPFKKLKKLPFAIALAEGPKADWAKTMEATNDQWTANAQLKMRKANQTRRQAVLSEDVAAFLRRNDIRCLGDL